MNQINMVCLAILVFAISSFNLYAPSRAVSSATIYIKPDDAANSDCPVEYPCVTLDHLALHELPNLSNTNGLSLIVLDGVHDSTIAIKFVHINHVVITGQRVNAIQGLNDSQPSIRMLASNIIATDVTLFEITNLAFTGDGKSMVTVQKHSETFSISVDQVHMTAVLFQVCPLDNGVRFKLSIARSIFKLCGVEIIICMYVTSTVKSGLTTSTVEIDNTKFLMWTKRQQNSLVVYSPEFYESQTVVVKLDHVTFMHRNDGAKLLPSLPPSYFCYGSRAFKPNRSSDILVSSSEAVLIVTNSDFNGNLFGSAIYAKNSEINITSSNFSGYTQGALVFSDSISLKLLIGYSTVYDNSAMEGEQGAVGLLVTSHGLIEIQNSLFHGNIDLSGNSQIIKLFEANEAKIQDSNFTDNIGTALNAKGTFLTMSGAVAFVNNTAHNGGALSTSSVLKMLIAIPENTIINFVNNTASQFGGALYLDNPTSLILSEDDANNNIWCFYQPISGSTFKNVAINFENNSAGKGGDHIYGNSIKNYCRFNSTRVFAGVWRSLFHIQPNASNSLSPVSSRAMRICVCDEGGYPLCDNESGVFVNGRSVYPGEVFSVSVIIAGAEFGSTVGEVYSGPTSQYEKC